MESKLDNIMSKKGMMRNWLTDRVVDDWNGLSNDIVSAELIGNFKRRLDKFMDEDDR